MLKEGIFRGKGKKSTKESYQFVHISKTPKQFTNCCIGVSTVYSIRDLAFGIFEVKISSKKIWTMFFLCNKIYDTLTCLMAPNVLRYDNLLNIYTLWTF